jgi:leucyl aminopeptidase
MFKEIRAAGGKPDLTVIGVHADQNGLPRGLPALDAATRRQLTAIRKRPECKGDAGELTRIGDRHLLLGLGKADDLTTKALRTIGGRLVRGLDRIDPRRVRLVIAEAIDTSHIGAEEAGRAIGEGMALANWRVDFFDGSASNTAKMNGSLAVSSSDRGLQKGLGTGFTIAEATNYARRLGATPPNICHPGWMAAEARKMARSAGLRCRVIDYAAAKQLGMGGLVNVGMASKRKPCLIILEHKPARIAAAARGVKLALVGKTITYDTGGYSLKISNTMKGMKYDKCGGMAVIGAMRAIAALKLPVHVVGLLPAAENMVAGDAYRPDDIIKMYNGVSVEVTNTDAEGRLVLGDALAYACKKLKPTAVVDMATLTGGVVVALGAWCAGLWCNDEDPEERIDTASEESGEHVWSLPLWDEHREFMRSRHADIWNSGPKRDGHAIQGAAFLSYFVDEDTPWAHIDIAGVASVDSDKDVFVQGPTGYGVRLLTDLVRGYAS